MLLTHSGFATAEDATDHLRSWGPELDRLEALLATTADTASESSSPGR